jgi:hypothetical protein
MKPTDVHLKTDEILFKDVVTGRYYILGRQCDLDLIVVIKLYRGRSAVPESEKIRVKEALTVEHRE